MLPQFLRVDNVLKNMQNIDDKFLRPAVLVFLLLSAEVIEGNG